MILEHPSPCNINGHSEIVKLSAFKAGYCYDTLRNESASTDKLIDCLGLLLAARLVGVSVLCILLSSTTTMHIEKYSMQKLCVSYKVFSR